jgi:hypothetical protein
MAKKPIRKKPLAKQLVAKKNLPAKKPVARRPGKRPVPREPLERLFPWGDEGRVIRNPELYLELRRAGVIAESTVGDDREWRHADKHWDFSFHADEWNHSDETRHGDEPAHHLDDKPDGVKPHGDSHLPPGGHGDQSGRHLDENVPHQDYSFHWDDPPVHADGPRHCDSHDDTPFVGHWDEKGPPLVPPDDHVDA